VPFERFQQRVVVGGDPADTQARQAVRLRQHVDRYGRGRPVDGLRQGTGPIQLETAVDLVGDQAQAVVVAQADQGAPGRLVGHRPATVSVSASDAVRW
jgi:hypothetical protein